jgi:hypothetical protein
MNELELLDQQRWLMNNGLFSDEAKNNIYVYGSLVNSNVSAVEVAIDVEKKVIAYKLYVSSKYLVALNKFNGIRFNAGFFALIRKYFLLKRYSNFDLLKVLKSFINDYCGPSWNVTMILIDEKEYQDEHSNEDDTPK